MNDHVVFPEVLGPDGEIIHHEARMPADSAVEIEAIERELRERGLDSIAVLRGEAPDTIETGQRVFAAAACRPPRELDPGADPAEILRSPGPIRVGDLRRCLERLDQQAEVRVGVILGLFDTAGEEMVCTTIDTVRALDGWVELLGSEPEI